MTFKLQTFWLALIAAVFLLTAPDAKACRDCPFPMKIGEQRWLMPDSQTVVMIHEIQTGSVFSMTVYLLDPKTDEILAVGTAERPRGQRSVTLYLVDRFGRRITGNITWVSYKDSVIRARFDYEEVPY